MGNFKLIFVLNDGTEITGKQKIDEKLDLFPAGILKKVKPICFEAAKQAEGWNYSIVRVYQSGKVEKELNLPQAEPFNDYFFDN